MSSLDWTAPLPYSPFFWSPFAARTSGEIWLFTISSSNSPSPHSNITALRPLPLPPDCFCKATGDGHSTESTHGPIPLTYQQHLMLLIVFDFLEMLSSLGIHGQAHQLPPLQVYPLPPAQRLVLRPSPVSPYSPPGSRGFKYHLFVDDWQIYTSMLDLPLEPLAHPSSRLLRNSAWMSQKISK